MQEFDIPIEVIASFFRIIVRACREHSNQFSDDLLHRITFESKYKRWISRNDLIFKKTYDLYKKFYNLRSKVSKQDRYTIYLKSENTLLKVLEGILEASQLPKNQKLPVLEKTSLKLNLLRVLLRLMKDVKSIDLKKYASLEEQIDEIGRMLGGWIKSTK